MRYRTILPAILGLVCCFWFGSCATTIKPTSQPSPKALDDLRATTIAPTTRPAEREIDELGIYFADAGECDLSSEQRGQFKEEWKALHDALAEYWKHEGPKRDRLNAELLEAMKTNDQARMKEVEGKQGKLWDGACSIINKSQREAMAILTTKQQTRYYATRLFRRMDLRLHGACGCSGVPFLPEQQRKIWALCEQASPRIAALRPELMSHDNKDQAEIEDSVYEKIQDQVMTDDQKMSLAKQQCATKPTIRPN